MANRVRVFAILPLLAIVLASTAARAEEPVASAPIPPPAATPLVVAPKAPPAAVQPKSAATVSKAAPAPKAADLAARRKNAQRLAASHRMHHKSEPRRHLAHASPPPAPPRSYRAAPPPEYVAEGPSMPPPWYDWGRPALIYPYPRPRGPMPPW